MSAVGKEEEIRKKLKSKPPLPPQSPKVVPQKIDSESKKAPKAMVQQIFKIKTDIIAMTGGWRLPLLQQPQLKPSAIKPRVLAPKELRKINVDRVTSSKFGTIQALKKAEIKLGFRILKAQLPEILGVRESIMSPLEEELKILPRSPKPAATKPKLTEKLALEVINKIALRRIPSLVPRRVIGVGKERGGEVVKRGPEVTRGEVPKSSTTPLGESERREDLVPEDVFVPPLLEELSSAARPISRPVCIVLPRRKDDSFVYSVAVICREIYRIIKGGKPAPRWISREELKEEIDRDLRAEGMIFVIDDPEGKLLLNIKEIRTHDDLKKRLGIILDRLRELFSQDIGFIIFHINGIWASQLANLLKEEVGYLANIIEIQTPNWQPQTKAIITKICWGFVEEKGDTFDEVFGHCEKKFFDELKKVKEDVELIHYIREDRDASPEHEAMKVMVVECLARELGASNKHEVIRMLEEKEIETERELDGGRADIYVRSQRRCVEIETFYGTGDPIDKLDKETLRKYLDLKKREYQVDRVDVVLLTGVHALLYAHRLAKLAKIYRKQHHLEVNFYLPDLREKRLIPLRELFRILRESVGPLKPAILTEDDIGKLWNEFSEKLRKHGVSPEKYRERFEGLINRFKSYQENRNWILEEVEKLIEAEKTARMSEEAGGSDV
jgi:hypothetical protein